MTVYLVGAGPGDPGLLTVRGSQVLSRADAVVHDRLAETSLLDLVPPSAERIDVGKSPGGPVDQDAINDLLISLAASHECVVRLKGGDPFVFGRGGEEAAALLAAGVSFEVVPGVTSAIAVPAYAGVPVTHRGLATSFTVVTGHSRHSVDQETNWEALAQAGGTIIVLMGVAHRAEIASRLIAGGLPAETSVLAVHWGTRPEQHSKRVRLDELGSTSLEPPVTLVIGAVADLDLAWFETQPLFGCRIVVTRASSNSSSLSARLRALGARPIEVPSIEVQPPADGGTGLVRAAAGLADARYAWVVFTSANAVGPLLDRLFDSRALSGVKVAAVGPATASALAARGIVADLVPRRQLAEGLLEEFSRVAAVGGAVLFPRAAEGNDVLVDGLEAKGWEVDLVEAYRTVAAKVAPELRTEVASADAVCFASSSAVRGFVGSFGLDAVPNLVVCIGPATAETASELGLRVDAVAERHDLDGLVEALIEAYKPH